jgi:RNA polymerase sigma-70 factor (ECF subfamily)
MTRASGEDDMAEAVRLHVGQRVTVQPPIAGEASESDAALLARAASDRDAFAALYRRYVGPVYRYCLHRLGHREAAEDATSQVFAQALAALPRYRERGSFRSWLFTIAHNIIADAARQTGRTPLPLDDLLAAAIPDPGAPPETAAIEAEAATTLRRLLATLPDEQRQVMELRLSGLSSPEVGTVLGRSPTAVRSLQFRAVERLRRLLAAEGGDHDAG